MYMKLLLALLILAILAGIVFLFTSSSVEKPDSHESLVTPEIPVTDKTAYPPARYVSVETDDVIEITPYTSGEDFFTGLGFVSIPLQTVPSEEGVRYEYNTTDSEVSVWIVNDEVIVYVDDELEFIGQPLQLADTETIERVNEQQTRDEHASIVTTLATTWKWQETTAEDGAVFKPNSEDVFTLTFTTDGKVKGTTDCNSFNGLYHIDYAGALTFNSLGMTRMFCADSQELEFVTPLHGSYYPQTSEGELYLRSIDNRFTITLHQ